LSISSGGNLLYISVERETLFRVSLGMNVAPQSSAATRRADCQNGLGLES
jgi:hypothetical protein